MTKITINGAVDAKDVAVWTAISLLSQLDESTQLEVIKEVGQDSGQVEVVVEVNGRTVDFRLLMERLFGSFDEQVEEKAEKLLTEKFGDLTKKMGDIEEILDIASEEMKRKLWS